MQPPVQLEGFQLPQGWHVLVQGIHVDVSLIHGYQDDAVLVEAVISNYDSDHCSGCNSGGLGGGGDGDGGDGGDGGGVNLALDAC